jgi:hypothetical protein
MKVHLMHPDEDFDVTRLLPAHAPVVTADLGLSTVWAAAAGGDRRVHDVISTATFQSVLDPAVVAYRQDVLADLRADPEVARALYELAGAAMAGEKRIYGMLRRTPSTTLHRSVEVLTLFVGHLRRLRALVDRHAGSWRAEGLLALAGMVRQELDDGYFSDIAQDLETLRFGDGIWTSARLADGNRGVGTVLRTPPETRGRWRERLHLAPSPSTSPSTSPSLSFDIHPRDEAGLDALHELHDRGLDLVANALAQSTDHVLAFFRQLRDEIAFYVGCLELERHVAARGGALCRPEVLPASSCPSLSATGLYDGALALRTGTRVVGNDLHADGRALVMITGANSGGKSTFLRAVGLAQLMAQCGMPVFATTYRTSACTGIFTHFARDEDAAMESGRFDEELSRMSSIADHLRPQALALFNESFAGTSEWEGSEIARHVVRALVESGVRVFFVTHLYDLAQSLYEQSRSPTLSLRAERLEGGGRSFKVLEGAPLPTSYGPDLYQRIGGFTP